MDTAYWFMFLARPLPASAHYSHVPAAFINAWVASSDPVIADHIARDAIGKEQWQIMRLQEWSVVSRQTYKYFPASLKHLDEALSHGLAWTFTCGRKKKVRANRRQPECLKTFAPSPAAAAGLPQNQPPLPPTAPQDVIPEASPPLTAPPYCSPRWPSPR